MSATPSDDAMYGQGEQPEQEAGQTPAGRDADPEEHGRARNSSNPSVGLFDLISFGLDSLISVRGPSGEAGEEYRRRRAEAGFPVPKLSRERDDGMPSQEEIYADLKSQKKMALAAILDLREEDVELKTEMAKVRRSLPSRHGSAWESACRVGYGAGSAWRLGPQPQTFLPSLLPISKRSIAAPGESCIRHGTRRIATSPRSGGKSSFRVP